MSLKPDADQWLRVIAPTHVGANIRRFTWTSYLGEVRHNTLGGITYLSPCEGKVVAANDRFTLVKTSANSFCLVLTELLSLPVAIGDKIALTFYKLRRFDGTAADGSDDTSVDGIRTFSLTGAETLFPVRWEDRYLGIHEKFSPGYREIQNPYLRDLITQCEKLPVDGGLRRIVNVLVDANARDLDFVDPPEHLSMEQPPAIKATVATGKFTGDIQIVYDRAMDYYGIRLQPTTGEPTTIEDICFDELGATLVDAIDDGTWRLAQTTVLKPAPKPRAARSTVTEGADSEA